MASLGAAFVVAVAGTFATTTFTRSPFYGGVMASALWSIVFAPTYFFDTAAYASVGVYAYTLSGVFLAVLLGAFVSKLLAQGQLVTVWTMSRGDERTVPYMLLVSVGVFFAVFFFVAGATNDNAGALDATQPAFLHGTVTLSTTTAVVVGVVLTLSTIALLIVSALPRQHGDRFHDEPDQMSALLFVGMIVVIVAPSVWPLATSLSTPIGRGVAAMATAFLVDGLVFGLGYWYEQRRYETALKHDRWHGRLYRAGFSATSSAVPLVVIALLHGLIFLFGGFAIDANGNDAQALFAFPWFSLAFVIAIGIVLVVYCAAGVCFSSVYRARARTVDAPPDDAAPLMPDETTSPETARRRRPVAAAGDNSDDFDV